MTFDQAALHKSAVEGTYDILATLLEKTGISELTEGFFEGDPCRSYDDAQNAQRTHLLELAGLKSGMVFWMSDAGTGLF